MSWIPKKTATSSAAPLATATRPRPAMTPASAYSLELPVVMSVRRLPAPVYGTLMEITAHGARLRSLVLMERGTDVEFDVNIGSAALTILGRVEFRRNAMAGARFEYQLSFDAMPESQIDVLAKAVRELEVRAAASRSIQRQIDVLPTTDNNRRTSYRALSAFPMAFRRDGGDDWAEAKVGDISATGIRMTCEELVAIGSMIEVKITLPSSVLDVYPEETATIDMSQGTPRRVGGRADMRRPFTEMTLRARVVTRFQPVRDREAYGVAFIEIDGYQREEIARFTHAVQLSKIRGS